MYSIVPNQMYSQDLNNYKIIKVDVTNEHFEVEENRNFNSRPRSIHNEQYFCTQ